ncbi:DUF4365 domain-containing protein [Streptomyces nigra]|uniref:DUF4365 domain-containing protein n=1 Tax=Streptomyces nigra TaxID=1827580 RepID=UPI003826CEA5
MSPKRPRSHLNADLSITRMQEAFVLQGWAVEILDKDYGEDLLVRIFENEIATPYTFYVQAKSTDSLKKSGSECIRYPIDFDHLAHWLEFWDPVFLMLWDRASGEILWDMIQEPSLPIDMSGKKAKLLIPRSNRLDVDGLRIIRHKAISRHGRFRREQQGSEALVSMLAEHLEAEIDYHPESGILTIEQVDGRLGYVLFGEMEELAEQLSEVHGTSVEAIVDLAICELAGVVESIEDSEPYEVETANGTVIRLRTVEELHAYLDDDCSPN